MQKALLKKGKFTLIRVKLVPSSSLDKVCEVISARIKIKIMAHPVKGEANQYLLIFLSKRLGLNINSLSYLRGMKSRDKDILVDLPIDQIIERLSID